MTIPRIGNKIVRVNNQIKQNTPVPSPVPDVSSSAEVPDYEDASLDDLSDDNVINKSENTPVPEETPAPMVNRNPEDNYSIEKFTHDYNENLRDEVLPILAQYEPERKQRLFLAVLLSAFFVSLALFLTFFTEVGLRSTVALYIFATLSWFLIKKSFENKIKKIVMPILIKAVPNFSWQLESPILEDDITECMILPNAKNAGKHFDDAFLGKYRGVDISIVECKYTQNRSNFFSGAVIRIKMNKDFEGVTVIRPKKFVPVKRTDDLKKAHMMRVELEDIEFNKIYNVYSNDQVEARYLLTTSFIERFKNINMAFASKVAYCSFYGRYVYIAPYCTSDLFSICSLLKNVADEQQFAKLFEELTSILTLIDYFKLDKKLGL